MARNEALADTVDLFLKRSNGRVPKLFRGFSPRRKLTMYVGRIALRSHPLATFAYSDSGTAASNRSPKRKSVWESEQIDRGLDHGRGSGTEAL